MDKNPDQKQTQKHQDDLPRLVQRKSSSTIHCDICFELYHIMGRWPMLACPNQHFFCDQCIQGMFKLSHNEPVPCPICRTLIRISLVKPHYEMFRMINKEKTVKNALKEQQNQLFLYAFQKEIFEVAAAFKSGKSNTISKFRKLDLSSRKISQFQHLKSFPSLVYLKADQNLIQSPKNLDELKNICFLNLNNNFIKNLQPLQQLKGLSYLAIQNNQIEEIPSLLPFSKLSHWFLFGNPLKHIVADQLMLVQFKNLSIFSFSVKNPQSSKAYNNFLNRIGELQTMPKLYRIFLQNQQNETKKEKLVRKPKNNIQIVWIQSKNLKAAKEHNNWVNNFMDETFQYGQVFHFKVDSQNPFIEDYNVMSDKIIKKNDKFTILNSLYCINKKGKVNFKFKMMTPNPNILLGLCGAYVKHNASIYSQHFVGLTFWGSIYVRGSCTTIAAKLRIEDKPVVRLSVDFQLMEIKWFCDDMLIGAVDFPQQLKYSSLYFLLGVRDSQTEIGLLKD